MKRTTINDLAKACGISKSTVSRALTQKGYVSEEVALKINNMAKEMNYIPQKSHNKNIKDMVMVISCQLSSEAQVILSSSISSALSRKNIKTVIAPCEFGSNLVFEYIDYAREKNFGGLILLGALETKELKRALASLSCPIVLLNQNIDYLETSSVVIDDYRCSYNSVQYLIENNHQKIAFLSGQENASAIKDRFSAYLDCMRDHKLKPEAIFKDFDKHSGAEFAEYLKQNSFPYTALIVATDEILNGFLYQAKKLNISIPDDISIISYGDTIGAKTFNPPITVIDYNFALMGEQLAELLLHKLEKPFSKPKKIINKPELIKRESVKKINP